MQFWRSRGETSDKAQVIFCSMSENDRMIFLSKNLLFIKWFLCTWKCRFDNPAETFSTNGRKFCVQCPKILRNVSALSKKIIFLSEFIYGKLELSVDNPAGKISRLGQKKVTQCPTMIEKATTFLRTLLIFRRTHMDRWIAFFTTTPNFLLQKADNFLLNVRKFWTKSQKNVSVDIWRLQIFVFLSNKRNVFFFIKMI